MLFVQEHILVVEISSSLGSTYDVADRQNNIFEIASTPPEIGMTSFGATGGVDQYLYWTLCVGAILRQVFHSNEKYIHIQICTLTTTAAAIPHDVGITEKGETRPMLPVYVLL